MISAEFCTLPDNCEMRFEQRADTFKYERMIVDEQDFRLACLHALNPHNYEFGEIPKKEPASLSVSGLLF